MKLISLAFGLCWLLVGCQQTQTTKTTDPLFKINKFTIDADTIVSSIAWVDDYLLCLQENDSIIVFDSLYKRIPAIEAKINTRKAEYLFTYNDTVFIMSNERKYFLGPDFKFTLYKSRKRTYGEPLFYDSSYVVYGCCVGEFGGAVFFLDNHSQKTYSYMATCATQVLKHKGSYVVCNNLAHLGRMMNFLHVKDPSRLYELTADSLKNFCNWYMEVDSLKDHRRKKTSLPITTYDGSYNSMSLISFSYRDSLYSLLCNDSSVVIAVHRDDSTFTTQVLLDHSLNYHESQVIQKDNKYAALFRLTGGSPFAAYRVTGNDFGLAVVKNGVIDILTRRKMK